MRTPTHPGRSALSLVLASVLIILAAEASAAAGRAELESWTLLIPREAMRFRDGATGPVYEATIVVGAEGELEVKGGRRLGSMFPSFLQVELEKTRFKKRTFTTTMTFGARRLDREMERDPRSGNFRGSVYLDFEGFDVAQAREALMELARPFSLFEAQQRGVLDELYVAMADSAFVPELRHLPLPKRARLLAALHFMEAEPPIERSRMLGKFYVRANLADVHHNIPADTPSNERVLSALSNYVLRPLEYAGEGLVELEGVHGIHLKLQLADGASQGWFVGGYSLEIYVPTESLLTFQEQRITVNQFLDDCLVFLDGKPVTPRFPYAR